MSGRGTGDILGLEPLDDGIEERLSAALVADIEATWKRMTGAVLSASAVDGLDAVRAMKLVQHLSATCLRMRAGVAGSEGEDDDEDGGGLYAFPRQRRRPAENAQATMLHNITAVVEGQAASTELSTMASLASSEDPEVAAMAKERVKVLLRAKVGAEGVPRVYGPGGVAGIDGVEEALPVPAPICEQPPPRWTPKPPEPEPETPFIPTEPGRYRRPVDGLVQEVDVWRDGAGVLRWGPMLRVDDPLTMCWIGPAPKEHKT